MRYVGNEKELEEVVDFEKEYRKQIHNLIINEEIFFFINTNKIK
jgi:hypothetical protein